MALVYGTFYRKRLFLLLATRHGVAIALCLSGLVRAGTVANAQTGAAAVETAAAGTAVPSSDPLTAFQKQALKAFSPAGVAFTKLTLIGTVDRTVGPLTEQGTVELKTSADGSLSESWTLKSGNRAVQTSALAGERTCSVTLGSKQSKPMEGVECQRMVHWFAPWTALSTLTTQFSRATETNDTKSGTVVLKVAPQYDVSAAKVSQPQSIQAIEQMASMDVMFDAASALPAGLRFSEPLSSDAANAIDISVVYSDYRLELGFMVPHHIQRYVQRTLESDIHINNVVLN